MTVQTLKLSGKRFVVVAEKDFRDLQRRAAIDTRSRSRQSSKTDARDRADITLARKRLTDPNDRRIPYEQVRGEPGLA